MEALQRLHNRGSISTGYDIDNSLKLENDNAEQLYYTPSSAGNLKTWTYSCWFKRTELSYNMMLFGANNTYAYFVSDDTLLLRFTGTYNFRTSKVFRDTAAWNHIVVAVDTTQATQADRIKIYFNGEDHTGLFASDSFPAQNTNTDWNNTLVHYVAGWATASFNPSCYLAEVYNIDGQKLEATDFGEFDEDTGIWKPKAYTGSYGTNGFHLDFTNSADLGEVAAGTQQNFVKINITSADQATDTPTNNFATFNPVVNINSTLSYTDGATEAASSAINSLAEGTMGFTSGKWYYEIVMPAASPNPSANMMMGFGRPNLWGVGQTDPGQDTYSFAYNRTGVVFYNGTTTSGWSAYSKDDVVMVAIDTTNGFAYFGVNGTWGNGGVPTSGSSGTGAFDYDSLVTNVAIGDLLIPAFSTGNAGNILQINFGGYTEVSIASGNTDENGYGNFEYAPPTGYYALCTKNLAEFG